MSYPGLIQGNIKKGSIPQDLRSSTLLFLSTKLCISMTLKILQVITFLTNRDLDVTHYMASVTQDDSSIKKYDLYAVCNHSGTLEHGHCKLNYYHEGSIWSYFDHSTVILIRVWSSLICDTNDTP